MSDVTHILNAIDSGDPRAAEQLLPLVYAELRTLAARRLAHEAPGDGIGPDEEEGQRDFGGQVASNSPPSDRPYAAAFLNLSGQLSFHFSFGGDSAPLIELNGFDSSAPPLVARPARPAVARRTEVGLPGWASCGVV